MQDSQNYESRPQQTIYVKNEPQSNGMGTAGFVLSLIALFLGWIPFIGWVVWLLGLIFSCIGVFRKPNGLAIAGLVISLIGILLLLMVFGALIGGAALL